MKSVKLTMILAAIALATLTSVGCRSKADAKAEVATKKPADTAKTVKNDDFANPNRRTEPEPTEIEEVTIEDAFFTFDSASLSVEGRQALANSAAWLEQNRNYKVVIEGHCDERGTEQYNMALGERRAVVARDYLVSLGIDASRITTTSFGEAKPFATGSSEAAWAENRRAHLVASTR